MKNFKQIFNNGNYIGIIHESSGQWYLTLAKKNLNLPKFRTCGNGIVREPGDRNKYSCPMTWKTKEEALAFLRENYQA